MAFFKILCPVDLSEPSREALKAAARLAAEASGELTLVYVWEPPVRLSDVHLMQSDLLEPERKRAEAALDSWKAEARLLGANTVTIKVLAGVPWKVIVDEVAANPSYDLLVVGTHGRTGIMRLVLGSVAERVARHADCPVLLVRNRTAR